MWNKVWIQKKIFIVFFSFIIVVLNVVFFLVFILLKQNYISENKSYILSEYNTISSYIDLNNQSSFLLLQNEVRKINNLWFTFYIWNDDKNIDYKYWIWFWFYNKNSQLIYRQKYNWYDIIIWKNIQDIASLSDLLIKIIIFINLIVWFFVFFVTYFLSKSLLKPVSELSKFISNYDISKPKKLFKNEYWKSEIWDYINSTNIFLTNVVNNFESQKYFIQDVSHELKTPLMQIDSTIELLEEKVDDEKVLKKLKNIKTITSNINNIISSLSFLLRWEEKWVNFEEIDLNIYLNNFILDYKDLLKQKNLEIKIEENSNFKIKSNKYYLDRLFWNLLSNAIYYNNWSSLIIISISKPIVSIKDFWIWISKDDLEKITNRFYRSNDSNLYNSNWNGLWLSIVKKVCDIFNYDLSLKSELWEGSEFSINFKI